MHQKTRVLIVDDERLARKRLRTLLAGESDMEVIAECGTGSEAVAAIRDSDPDLVFLDVQMPELDGFEVVRAIGLERMPVVVFVTAFGHHALEAFEVQALDYLTKPFDRERFGATLRRARAQLRLREGGRALDRRLLALLEHLDAGRRYADRVMVKSAGHVIFLRVSEIDWVEAAGNYVRLHVGRHSHLLHERLVALEAKLDPAHFVRIHRSTIVNLNRIRELQPWFRGDAVVLLHDGTKLAVSRSYRGKVVNDAE